VKLALRRIKKSPGFVITVCLILALGIGANLTVFLILPIGVLFDLQDYVRAIHTSNNGNPTTTPT
jgi:hypothetical protein